MADMVNRKMQLATESTEVTERKSSKKIIVFKTIDIMSDFVIAQWKTISEKAIKGKGYFSVALSGGKTPVFLYKKLSHQKTFRWDKTHIFMVDERFVPYENEENNFHMINDALLTHVSIPKENVHAIATDEDTSKAAAEKYEMDMLSFFKNNTEPPQFDLILLGIGSDGHTASIFPGTPVIKEKNRWAVAVLPSDKEERITVTLPVINNAANVMFLATGSNKAGIIKKVIEEDALLPATMVRPVKGNLFFLLDESSGAQLKN